MNPTQVQFVSAFNNLQDVIHGTAVAKGFWDKPRNDGEAVMLMVTELAEAVEAMRHGNPPDDKIPQFSGVEAELADCIIRAMDFAAGRKLRLAEAIVAKMEFNATRERLHGKGF
jgi:NTP pyrophosphatase (non-canonical NTP hydrolase)